ncbi:bZIP transcription factor TRAB1 [Mangifera indica]|uniref:bZIP transcription factor TRAB1 n=1 Tax=Mangifera indica TaxID=29780 RepID=UPI001CFBABAA|nr:bZIP transcription factor TRAB1 [Mangifera indica]XP_044474654.1 bZIP transcription factor TRAB1 [Mangifera indica]XP_044474655.1 bZIP transcription factor TRAB1 [Mangifera indica]
MGSNINFKSLGNEPPYDPSKPLAGNFPLTRQPSIYSLTFDEFQSTVGGSLGKDFGSLNMDELLKNIWTAEETQSIVASSSGNQDGTNGLQRQGSLTLPRTLSQKTVDEVWKDISKEYVVKDGSGGGGNQGSNNMPKRQQTLGEMTLEEFLVRAGVVREDMHLGSGFGKIDNNAGFFGDLPRSSNNTGFGFQQMVKGANLMGNENLDKGNQISIQSSNLPLNVNGARLSQHPLAQQQQQQQQPQHPQIFPKQPTVAYQMPLQSSPGIKSGIVGVGDQTMTSSLIQGSAVQNAGMGMIGLGAGPVVATGSPANQLTSNGIGKSNGDTSSVSPVPYMFNGGLRGRKFNGNVEKVVERRQRRMIKNRESAARSRARKQAYTMELEAEVAKLKEENQELQRKHAEIMEIQKNQALEMMNAQQGAKKRCLRRTQTGPW